MTRILLLVPAFLVAFAASAWAAQSGGGGGGGLGFDCPPDDEICTCDGTYTDCNNMKVACVDGTMQCKRVDGLERCWCQRKTTAIRRKIPAGRDRTIVPTLK